MAGQTIIKPQTNIPITGIVEFCDFIPTRNPQYSDQIALRGKWDGAGDARIYLHLNCEGDMQRLGIVGQRQQNGNYPLLVQAPRIKLCKVEQNGQKRTLIELIGHAGALAQQVQQFNQQPQQGYAQQGTYQTPAQPQQGSLYPPAQTQAPMQMPANAPQQQQYAQPPQNAGGPSTYPAPGANWPNPTPAAQPSYSPAAAAPTATVAEVATTVPELCITFTDCLKLAEKIVIGAGGTMEHHLPQVFETATALFAVRCRRNLLGKTEFVPF